MDVQQARTVVDGTLYEGESVLAFGRAVDVNDKTIKFVGYNPNGWIAFTQYRFIDVAEASGNATSYRLPEIEVLELRRRLFAGPRLYFDPAGLGADMGLAIFRIDKALAQSLAPLLATRRSAPALPVEHTSYVSVTVPTEGHLVAVLGAETESYRCTVCGGSCGTYVKGESVVYPDCAGCLRLVDAAANEASA